MVKKFTANISEWFKKRLGSTASNIKMNGTQSAGTSENVAREDHVHPVDTSRAASSHTHGNITNAGAIGTAANKPIITTTSGKLAAGSFESTASNIKMDGTQSVGSLNTFARADHVHPTDTSRASTDPVTQSDNGLALSTDKQKIDKSMVVGFANAAGTTSAFTASITGVTLTHGTIIALYNAVGANTASATLNVNSLGAKPIYYNASAIPASRYPNKATCLFMYNTSIVSTGVWQLIYSYDSNTTYSLTSLKDSNAHDNIGTAASASQADINTAVDSTIATLATKEEVDEIIAGDIDLTGYVKDTDSRLSDARTPKSHAHGNISNAGVISNAASKNVVTDANGKITTEDKPTVPSANSTATNIKMDGTQSAGSLATFAKADHVHPTDTSRAAASHSHTKSEITDFPTTMTPASHAHGNVTNDGKVGTTANKPLITGTGGVVQAGSFGTAANTFCQGNDSRLSDARTPTSHSHGSLANGGTLNSDITSVNKIAVTDSSNNLKTISKLPADKVTHQDISGKVDTAGTGLSKDGTTLNHSNSVTAQTSNALKKIKFDAQGHITGTAAVAKSDITDLGIPAQDTVYTHPSYTARTGKPTANQTPAFGGTATVSQITSDATGHVTGATDRTIKIPDTSASTSSKGLVQLDAAPVDASSNVVTSGGLFTALDAKQNASETQSKVVFFTEKDRINVGRVLDFINNSKLVSVQNAPSPLVSFYGESYYKLELTAIYLAKYTQYVVTSSDNNDKLPAENIDEEGIDLYCSVYLNGVKQEATTQSVTFKKLDGTVIGTSNTNSGDSILGKTIVANAITLQDIGANSTFFGVGIHYIYAEATINGSVVRSNIVSVFVKENQNTLSHNLYSGGEYENSTNGFYRINTNTNIITSNDYSVIGEQSFKINIISDSTASLIIDRTTHNTGAILTGKLYIQVLSGSVTIRLHETSTNKRTDVVVNNGIEGMINISHTVTSTQQVQFLIIPEGEGTSYYIDNISLTTS